MRKDKKSSIKPHMRKNPCANPQKGTTKKPHASSSNSPTATNHFPFFNLPRELRNKIYEQILLPHSQPLSLNYPTSSGTFNLHNANILLACPQAWREALWYYQRSTFTLRIPSYGIRLIRPFPWAHIRNLEIPITYTRSFWYFGRPSEDLDPLTGAPEFFRLSQERAYEEGPGPAFCIRYLDGLGGQPDEDDLVPVEFDTGHMCGLKRVLEQVPALEKLEIVARARYRFLDLDKQCSDVQVTNWKGSSPEEEVVMGMPPDLLMPFAGLKDAAFKVQLRIESQWLNGGKWRSETADSIEDILGMFQKPDRIPTWWKEMRPGYWAASYDAIMNPR